MKYSLVGFAGPKKSGKNEAGIGLIGWYKHEMTYLLKSIIEAVENKTMSDYEYEVTKEKEFMNTGRSYRDVYIAIGKILREEVDHDILAKHMIKKFLESQKKMYVPNIRLEPEAHLIKKYNGIIIEIRRDGCDYNDSIETETRLPERYIDTTIYNDGTILELHNKIRNFLEII